MILQRGLIVSCQALPGEPLHGEGIMPKMAKAAEMAGAVGVRLNGVSDIKAVRYSLPLPIIGIIKRNYENFGAYITPTMREIAELAEAHPHVVALDATALSRPDFENAADYIRAVKKKYPHLKIMADISNYDEAIAAQDSGADYVGTTMAGYTPWTVPPTEGPDFELLKRLVADIKVPIIAEGRIETGEQARRCMDAGAFAVVVGGAITRPQNIARKFVEHLS